MIELRATVIECPTHGREWCEALQPRALHLLNRFKYGCPVTVDATFNARQESHRHRS
jgi:hypothetical protein